MTTAAEILDKHQQSGATKFFHRNGQAFVEYPKCGCGERMHPRAHAQHQVDVLAEAGFRIELTDDEAR